MGGATWGLFFLPWYWALQGGIETDRNGWDKLIGGQDVQCWDSLQIRVFKGHMNVHETLDYSPKGHNDRTPFHGVLSCCSLAQRQENLLWDAARPRVNSGSVFGFSLISTTQSFWFQYLTTPGLFNPCGSQVPVPTQSHLSWSKSKCFMAFLVCLGSRTHHIVSIHLRHRKANK